MMRIAILSDSHDNIWKLAKAMPALAEADEVIHCGDLISPFMIIRLIQGTRGKPVHIVWGNNDGDKGLIAEVASQAGNITLHGDFADLELGGLKIAVNHYPKVARSLAESGSYDVVCYGHDHIRHDEWVGKTLLLNPGELMGLQGRSTIAILDSRTRNVEFLEI
ncbi:metallophosphoesterase [Chloroflexota bacterium]